MTLEDHYQEGFFFLFYAILKGNSHPGEAEFFLE